ncbi:MAG: lipid A biosynthesis protein [Rhodanobacteraceae bacterium]|nr:MAG: lipid A biosynthesis protein [Rhodanobacteraceae bacterium]
MTLPDYNAAWIAFGFLGQLFFGLRFLVQWLYSEKQGKSRVPHAFWYLSVVGGAIILTYAIHQHELVFIIGESITLFIFLRNLHLLRRPG